MSANIHEKIGKSANCYILLPKNLSCVELKHTVKVLLSCYILLHILQGSFGLTAPTSVILNIMNILILVHRHNRTQKRS